MKQNILIFLPVFLLVSFFSCEKYTETSFTGMTEGIITVDTIAVSIDTVAFSVDTTSNNMIE